MAIKVRDVIRWLEDLAPLHLAEEGQSWTAACVRRCGDGDHGVIDFTQEVLAEGLEGVNLFVTTIR